MTAQEQQAAFGAALRRLRKGRRLTQPALADLVGVSLSTIAQWEGGRTGATEQSVLKLEEILGAAAGELGHHIGYAATTPEEAIEADAGLPAELKRTLLARIAAARRVERVP